MPSRPKRLLLGDTRLRAGRFDEAETPLLDAFEMSRRLVGDAHPFTLVHLGHLAEVHFYVGRRDQAIEEAEDLLARQRAIFSDGADLLPALLLLTARPRRPRLARCRGSLARCALDEPDRALAFLAEAADPGYADAGYLAGHPHFVPLHGPDFDELLDFVRSNAEEHEP